MIERIFGVTKDRFDVMAHGCEYPFETQVKLIPAMCAIHNFIRLHDATELAIQFPEFDENYVPNPSETANEEVPGTNNSLRFDESQSVDDWRDSIAQAMWDDYCLEQEAMGARRRQAQDFRGL